VETIKADEIVRMYFSFLSLYRIVLQAKKLDKSTFFNFYQPVIDVGRTYSRVCSLKELFRRYAPWHQYIPLNQGIPWEPTWMEDGINQNTVHGNFVNQRLLKPVHDWLMAVLRKLPTDGTFKRHPCPIGQTCCHCFDLKSATDRWPLCLMFEVMCHLFDRSFASEMVNSALETHIFCVPLVPYFLVFLLNLKWYASSGSFGATLLLPL